MFSIERTPNNEPHASCYHKPTSMGDSFGGLGTDREYKEENPDCLGTAKCRCLECLAYDDSSRC